jgi:NADH-quinone oxidoreductase subunit J
MTVIFYLCAVIAVLSTMMVITRLNAVHALLYFIVSLLAVAVIFYVIGAPFVAALEVIIYAGAIMVLFVFVVMLLNLGPQSVAQERQWLTPGIWIGPSVLAALLIALLVAAFDRGAGGSTGPHPVDPRQVGIALFGPYLLGTELASMLLLAGLVGAYHLGRRERISPRMGGMNHRDTEVTEEEAQRLSVSPVTRAGKTGPYNGEGGER